MAASDDEHATSVAFALQVLGLDGVADAPPEGSVAARLTECELRMRSAGSSSAEIAAALDEILREQDEAEGWR